MSLHSRRLLESGETYRWELEGLPSGSAIIAQRPKTTIGRVAIDFPVQRLQIGDVLALPEQGSEVEATVAREIDRTELTVRVTLRVEGREDFIKEWPIGEMVTVVRGP